MKIAFDIGGVLSKYPSKFAPFLSALQKDGHEVHIITDIHKLSEVKAMLWTNMFDFIPTKNVHVADYTKHGEMCKAILLKQLGIDIFFDDFIGYTQWDSSLGPAPIRLLVMPDPFRPYWSDDWVTADKSDFGRRVSSLAKLKGKP